MFADPTSFTRLASLPLSASLAPFAALPSFGPSGVSQVLELQHHFVQLWIDSAQTIAMRFWLAPPWLAGSAWVRDEWWRMTAEKFAASGESLTAAVAGTVGAASTPWFRTARLVLAPYTRRTSGNAKRLVSRAALGPLPLFTEAVTGRVEGRAGILPPARRPTGTARRRR